MSWYQLLSIIRLNDDERRAWRNAAPEACPKDGTPLKTGPNGELFCPFDGWTWDGSPHSKRPPAG